MKKTDFKDKSPVFYISKGMIILTVIITSSLGFTLGFFVGKFYRTPAIMQSTEVVVKDSSPQQVTEDIRKDSAESQPPVVQGEQTPAQAQGSEEKQAVKPVQKSRPSVETKPAQPVQKTAPTKENTKPSSLKTYGVQVGAFRNESDAHALMLKLEKKGYHAAVALAKSRNDKIYKVLVGEFKNRDEAEIVAIKIKKAEGLKAFVTFRNHEEAVR